MREKVCVVRGENTSIKLNGYVGHSCPLKCSKKGRKENCASLSVAGRSASNDLCIYLAEFSSHANTSG